MDSLQKGEKPTSFPFLVGHKSEGKKKSGKDFIDFS
jgi:hypothetical protein